MAETAIGELGFRAAGVRSFEAKQKAKAARIQGKMDRNKHLFNRLKVANIDIGWAIFIASISFAILWFVSEYMAGNGIPPLGASVSMLLITMIPLIVYYFATGGNLVEAVMAIIILFAIVIFGSQIPGLEQFFSTMSLQVTTGESLKFALMSLI